MSSIESKKTAKASKKKASIVVVSDDEEESKRKAKKKTLKRPQRPASDDDDDNDDDPVDEFDADQKKLKQAIDVLSNSGVLSQKEISKISASVKQKKPRVEVIDYDQRAEHVKRESNKLVTVFKSTKSSMSAERRLEELIKLVTRFAATNLDALNSAFDASDQHKVGSGSSISSSSSSSHSESNSKSNEAPYSIWLKTMDSKSASVPFAVGGKASEKKKELQRHYVESVTLVQKVCHRIRSRHYGWLFTPPTKLGPATETVRQEMVDALVREPQLRTDADRLARMKHIVALFEASSIVMGVKRQVKAKEFGDKAKCTSYVDNYNFHAARAREAFYDTFTDGELFMCIYSMPIFTNEQSGVPEFHVSFSLPYAAKHVQVPPPQTPPIREIFCTVCAGDMDQDHSACDQAEEKEAERITRERLESKSKEETTNKPKKKLNVKYSAPALDAALPTHARNAAFKKITDVSSDPYLVEESSASQSLITSTKPKYAPTRTLCQIELRPPPVRISKKKKHDAIDDRHILKRLVDAWSQSHVGHVAQRSAQFVRSLVEIMEQSVSTQSLTNLVTLLNPKGEAVRSLVKHLGRLIHGGSTVLVDDDTTVTSSETKTAEFVDTPRQVDEWERPFDGEITSWHLVLPQVSVPLKRIQKALPLIKASEDDNAITLASNESITVAVSGETGMSKKVDAEETKMDAEEDETTSKNEPPVTDGILDPLSSVVSPVECVMPRFSSRYSRHVSIRHTMDLVADAIERLETICNSNDPYEGIRKHMTPAGDTDDNDHTDDVKRHPSSVSYEEEFTQQYFGRLHTPWTFETASQVKPLSMDKSSDPFGRWTGTGSVNRQPDRIRYFDAGTWNRLPSVHFLRTVDFAKHSFPKHSSASSKSRTKSYASASSSSSKSDKSSKSQRSHKSKTSIIGLPNVIIHKIHQFVFRYDVIESLDSLCDISIRRTHHVSNMEIRSVSDWYNEYINGQVEQVLRNSPVASSSSSSSLSSSSSSSSSSASTSIHKVV